MLILAIDTSGKSGGISLAEGGPNSFRILGSSPIAGGTFSAQLVPTLSSLLQKHGLAAKDIEGFAAASGPGSFTGLRVGLSAIKGLAEEQLAKSVHLLDEEGVHRGAEAVFRTLARAPGRGWPLWLYRRLPGFAPATRFVTSVPMLIVK